MSHLGSKVIDVAVGVDYAVPRDDVGVPTLEATLDARIIRGSQVVFRWTLAQELEGSAPFAIGASSGFEFVVTSGFQATDEGQVVAYADDADFVPELWDDWDRDNGKIACQINFNTTNLKTSMDAQTSQPKNYRFALIMTPEPSSLCKHVTLCQGILPIYNDVYRAGEASSVPIVLRPYCDESSSSSQSSSSSSSSSTSSQSSSSTARFSTSSQSESTSSSSTVGRSTTSTVNQSTSSTSVSSSSSSSGLVFPFPRSYNIAVGTLNGGRTEDLAADDGSYLSFAEVIGTPGMEVDLIWAAVPSSDYNVQIIGYYGGSVGHNKKAQMWNYTTSSWVNLTGATDDFPKAATDQTYSFAVPDDNYVSGGAAQFRIDHTSPGNAAHIFWLDKVSMLINNSSSSTS